ncbi:MAG: biopolymer transporter ExbD [Hyphomonadaceae bacterium]|nr:biopolymer transporter ExbD [Hyphomonadaceae bacterium]
MAGGLAASARGSRRRSARRTRLSEINVTPFVDVMLVLLIVFMVTAPLLTVSVPIELPRTDAKQSQTETDPLSVTVTRDGTIFLQETEVSRDELVAKMRAISREGYDRRVFIRGDNNASYGAVLDVMAQLSSAGFRNLDLVSDTRDGVQQLRPRTNEE